MIELELLGLNKYEALAYEALVRLGKVGAFEIARESGVPYGRIYDTLNSLVAKGLVLVVPEKTKKFVAAPPEALEKLFAAQESKFSKLKEEIKNLKKFYVPAAEEPVEIIKGKRNFYKIIQKMPEPKKYDYAFKYTSEVLPEWARAIRKHLRRNVDMRILARYDTETKSNVERWKKLVPKLQQRKFDTGKISGEIIDDKAVFFALLESNTTILIRDSQFAKLMKKLFEAAEERSEEI